MDSKNQNETAAPLSADQPVAFLRATVTRGRLGVPCSSAVYVLGDVYEVLYADRPNPTRLEREELLPHTGVHSSSCCCRIPFKSIKSWLYRYAISRPRRDSDLLSRESVFCRVRQLLWLLSAVSLSHNLLPDLCVSDGRVPKGAPTTTKDLLVDYCRVRACYERTDPRPERHYRTTSLLRSRTSRSFTVHGECSKGKDMHALTASILLSLERTLGYFIPYAPYWSPFFLTLRIHEVRKGPSALKMAYDTDVLLVH